MKTLKMIEKTDRELEKAVDTNLAGVPPLTLKERMEKLEARRVELAALLADAPEDRPDLLPTASAIYAKKVAKLTEALARPGERPQAAEALRMLIEKIVLTPGPERGELLATLHGELGTILNWTDRQAMGTAAKKNTPGAGHAGVSCAA